MRNEEVEAVEDCVRHEEVGGVEARKSRRSLTSAQVYDELRQKITAFLDRKTMRT